MDPSPDERQLHAKQYANLAPIIDVFGHRTHIAFSRNGKLKSGSCLLVLLSFGLPHIIQAPKTAPSSSCVAHWPENFRFIVVVRRKLPHDLHLWGTNRSVILEEAS